MSVKKKFSINVIQLADSDIQSIEDDFNRNKYSDETGIGIIDFSSDGSIVAATLLKRIPSFINEYNVQSNGYEKRSVFIYQQMEFEVDLNYNLLYTIGTQGNLPVVRGFLKSVLRGTVAISNMETSPYNVYKLLKGANVKFKVTSIGIEGFDFKGAIGKFSATITERAVANELINTYKEGINKMAIDIQYDADVFSVHIYSGGVIGVASDEDSLQANFDFIKQILFR